VPLFYAYNIEDQLASMYDPIVKLRSGGYIVINPTEALISIDVNSGRMTGERNIEETATKTNLEAVSEIARQLRLRDLAGLIVIDLIDMMDSRNRRSVERALKDALKLDRAKIQLGRISAFGLLEMSRQRLRPSISETSSMPCPHCQGKGVIRSDASVAIQVVRAMEKEAAGGTLSEIRLTVPPSVALHLLNGRRDVLTALEQKFGIRVTIATDGALPQSQFRLEKIKNQSKRSHNNPPPVSVSESAPYEAGDGEESQESAGAESEIDTGDSEILVSSSDSSGAGAGGREERPRRRGRRGGRNRQRGRFERGEENVNAGSGAPEEGLPQEARPEGEQAFNDNRPPRQDRGERGERGGRRRRGGGGGGRWRENRDRNQQNGSAPQGDHAQPQAGGDGNAPSYQPAIVATNEPHKPALPPQAGNAAPIPPLSEQAGADTKPKKGWWRRIVES
jgi:ribonuclease E